MARAIVISEDAAKRLAYTGHNVANEADPLEALPPGTNKVSHEDITYVVGEGPLSKDARLLIISCEAAGPLSRASSASNNECFQRILRVALSQFEPGLVSIPLGWKPFHVGSLLSFQANRLRVGKARVAVDFKPADTKHVFAYNISESSPLTRESMDEDLFLEAVLGYEHIATIAPKSTSKTSELGGHKTFVLSPAFSEADITLGIPFSVWRDAKLTRRQREFFEADFVTPLRVKGPAGSGKTLALVMRFLKEIYQRIERQEPVRACFLTHSDEVADNLRRYLSTIDERGLLYSGSSVSTAEIEITTLHNLANRYISRDGENIEPLSLDGSEGRRLQFEAIEGIITEFLAEGGLSAARDGCREEFIAGLESPKGDPLQMSFCYDLSDEFANVLETLSVRSLEDISMKYLKQKPSERALARSETEKHVVLELYRRFRKLLNELGVVSLDQFTADFLAYLNSFRWEALRKQKGFDFVFADELHLFNAQERRVLGFLLRSVKESCRVAVAYDPRQSPRNTFFPDSETGKDTIWTAARLDSTIKPFELTDVFRYTPEILRFIDFLNRRFPAVDLAEEWQLTFGHSLAESGPIPTAQFFSKWSGMLQAVADRARRLLRESKSGEQVAVLCLDPSRFDEYINAMVFREGFVRIEGRDDVGDIWRYSKRAVLSMPEYVAGLQFSSVLLVDANAKLVTELGGGANGVHRFLSSVYLGASRAKNRLELFADGSAGGFAESIREAVDAGLIELVK